MPPPTAQRRHGAVIRRRQPGSAAAAEIASEARRIQDASAKVKAGAAPAAPAERKPITAFRISPIKPLGERMINCLVYGPYGHGKTTFAGSADDVPSMRDVLFINMESGDMSLTNRRTLDIININKYTQLARVFEYLTLHCMYRDQNNVEKLLELERELKAEVIPIKDQTSPVKEGRTWFEEQRLRADKPMDEPYLYRTVILDSLSEAHKYLIYKYTGVNIGKTKLDEEIEKMEEWQPAQELFRLLIRSFRDLPMNCIFVSAEAIEPAEKNKKRNPRAGQALPKLAGQMAGDIAGFIDIVGYLVRERDEEGGDNRYLYLGAGYEGWISKHRFENLPDLDYVTNPTLASLIDLARKDAEQHGTSHTRSGPEGRTVTPSRNTARPAASNSGSAAAGTTGRTSSPGRRGDNTVRRQR